MVNQLKAFWNEEEGVGIIEIILILVVLIMLIVIFRDKIQEIVKSAFSNISKDSSTINKNLILNNSTKFL